MYLWYFAIIVILSCPCVLSEWRYSQIDDLVLSFNGKTTNDSKTYRHVVDSLTTKPREFNESLCLIQFQRIFDGVIKNEKWALKVMDSWGKLPAPGLYWGRVIDFGHYDECMSVAHDFGDDANIFVGQYCLASYPLDMITRLTIEKQDNAFEKRKPSIFSRGVCVPDSCSPSMLDEIFKQLIFNETNQEIDIQMFEEVGCSRNEELELDTPAIVGIAIFGSIGILVILSTTYDILAGYYKQKKSGLFIAFSVVTNSQRLFKLEKRAPPPGAILCLNGLRFISMIWVVYTHIFTVLPYIPRNNYKYLWEWMENLYPMLIVSGPFAVDTFFLLSGFLLAKTYFRIMDKRGTISFGRIAWMFIHRYIRLFPVLAATVLFSSSIYRYIGDGPYFKKVGLAYADKCREYWWSTLLHVQNIVNPLTMCLNHTWYLSTDTQLYLLAPLVIVPLHKWGKKFLAVVILLIVASSSYIFAVTIINDVSIRAMETIVNNDDASKTLLYYGVHTRGSPWLIGVILAYFLNSFKGKKCHLSTLTVIAGWICCTVVMAALIFGPYEAQQLNSVQNSVSNAFYSGLSKIGWGLVLSWIIFACNQGYGGLVNAFLSHTVWTFFGRLNYAIYITHPVVQLTMVALVRVNTFFTNLTSIQLFWSDFGIIMMMSITLVLFFEAPTIAVEKYILGGGSRNRNVNGNVAQENTRCSNELRDNGKTGPRS